MNPPDLYQLQVLVADTKVGTLTQDKNGLVRWAPDPTWLQGGQQPRLGARFLRDPHLAPATSLPSWFENLLPERRSALRDRITRAYGLDEGSSFALLERLGRDLPGGVQVVSIGPRPKPQALGVPFIADLSTLPSSSLAGMQLKFSMSMDGERLALSAQGGGRIWIVKLPGDRYPELAEVEAATTAWAKRAGHEVPEHRVVPFAALDGLPNWMQPSATTFAIERFDRLSDGRRQHHEDLCQAFDLPPERKDGALRGGAITYASVIRLVRDLAGDADAQIVARRLGFMLASGNGDLHLKNFSLLWPAGAARARISPCYDLVATIAWPEFGWEDRQVPRMALWLGKTKRFADVDQTQLAVLQEDAGVDWLVTEVQQGIAAAARTYRPEECPERMRAGLREHARRVPVLKPHRTALGADST